MSAEPHPSPEPSQYLLERVGLINRIQTALRSTLNIEDIYSIVLSTLVTRNALGFSRALLAGYNETDGMLQGIAALGAEDRETHERVQSEIEAEEKALAHMARGLSSLEADKQEETLFRRSLRDLSDHSFWITTYQKYSTRQNLSDQVRRFRLEWPAPDAEHASAPPYPFLRKIVQSDSCVPVTPDEMEVSGIPAPLRDALRNDSLWKAIKTQKGLRLLLIVDKAFQDLPIQQIDLLHLEWFSGQVSLALENAEMYQDVDAAYQDLRELDRLKSNFLATISHELRTPLTAINGYVQLLAGHKLGDVSKGQIEVLERIMTHSELLTRKVNDLIEIAELDAGQAELLELESVDPLNVLVEVLPKVEHRRAQMDIAIEPVVDRPIPNILASEQSLRRIFTHLIDNAIKFGHPHGTLRVEFETAEDRLYIHFIDNGIGIPETQLKTIFDAFYQIDNQLTRTYEGMGLGLTIIKKQLELTGGQIKVYSQPEKGSRFTIIYPLA